MFRTPLNHRKTTMTSEPMCLNKWAKPMTKVVADSTFPEYVARALNVRTPGGFSGAAISSYGKVIGMSFGNSTRKSDISFFYDGMLLSGYIRNQNRPTTTDVSKCVYQVRSYVTVQ